MRILVVDDDFVSRTKLKVALSEYGDVDAVPNGEIALAMFKCAHEEGAHYNLITMDVDMPGMRGQEVVRSIREWERAKKAFRDAREAKVLMITALDDKKDIISSFSKGCEGYLVKPVTPEKLRDALLKLGIKFAREA